MRERWRQRIPNRCDPLDEAIAGCPKNKPREAGFVEAGVQPDLGVLGLATARCSGNTDQTDAEHCQSLWFRNLASICYSPSNQV